MYYRYPGARAERETDYAEGFAGVTWRNVNARFYVTPHYFGGGRSALYAELNATFALSERVAVTAHAGYARITGLYNRIDVSTSILIDLRHATLELAAVATDIPPAECPLGPRLAGRGSWRCCRGAFNQPRGGSGIARQRRRFEPFAVGGAYTASRHSTSPDARRHELSRHAQPR